jgi:cobalt-zinc-cadmium efflux system outer membrane protein
VSFDPNIRRARAGCALLAIGGALALTAVGNGTTPPAELAANTARRIPHVEASVPESIPAAPPAKLSLEELVGRAQATHPAINAAAARLDAARGAWVQTGLGPNPVIGYEGDEIGSDGTAGFQGGFVEKTFMTGGKLRLNRTVASQEVAKAQAELAAAQQRVVNDVRTAYYDVLVAQRGLDVTGALVRIAEDSTNVVKRLWDRGESSESDWRQARVEANMIRIKQATAVNRHLAAWRQLAVLVGDPCLPPGELVDDLQNGVAEVDWCEVVERTLAASPEVAAAWSEVERSRWALRRAEVEPLPDVTLQAGVMRDNVARETVASAMASIPLPIINNNRGGILQAAAELRRAQSEAERVELRLRHQLAAAFARYQSSRAAVERYNKEVLADAEATLNLVTKVYEAGEADYQKQLSAQRTYFQTRLDYIEALGELRKAAVQLDGLMLSGSLEAMK